MPEVLWATVIEALLPAVASNVRFAAALLVARVARVRMSKVLPFVAAVKKSALMVRDLMVLAPPMEIAVASFTTEASLKMMAVWLLKVRAGSPTQLADVPHTLVLVPLSHV